MDCPNKTCLASKVLTLWCFKNKNLMLPESWPELFFYEHLSCKYSCTPHLVGKETLKSCDSCPNKSVFCGEPGCLGQCCCLLLRALERHLSQHRGISGKPAPSAANSQSSSTSFNPADSYINGRIVFYFVNFPPSSGEKSAQAQVPLL